MTMGENVTFALVLIILTLFFSLLIKVTLYDYIANKVKRRNVKNLIVTSDMMYNTVRDIIKGVIKERKRFGLLSDDAYEIKRFRNGIDGYVLSHTYSPSIFIIKDKWVYYCDTYAPDYKELRENGLGFEIRASQYKDLEWVANEYFELIESQNENLSPEVKLKKDSLKSIVYHTLNP
jgi:hypothetical protein